jgi:hypothetical protein
MRPDRIKLWACLLFLSFFTISSLSGCLPATKPPPPPCTREYRYPGGAAALYRTLASHFKDQGHLLTLQIPNRGYLETAWEDGTGRQVGLSHYTERRKYEVRLTDGLSAPSRVCLTFDLVVQEKAPRENSPWKSLEMNMFEDDDYLRLLRMIDETVETSGGRLY